MPMNFSMPHSNSMVDLDEMAGTDSDPEKSLAGFGAGIEESWVFR